MKVIDLTLLDKVSSEAKESPRLRMNYNFHQSLDDKCHRFLNAVEPGTVVPIHRHLKTSETVVCLEGCLDWVFYEEIDDVRCQKDDVRCVEEDGVLFKETAGFRVCPREKVYGIQVPKGAWHSIEVYEPSTIFEAKDGAYEPQR